MKIYMDQQCLLTIGLYKDKDRYKVKLIFVFNIKIIELYEVLLRCLYII